MSTLKSILLFTSNILFMCLFFCLIFLAKPANAQIKLVYRIAVYEKNRRNNLNESDHIYQYEIRNLFRRADSVWIDNADSSSISYYKVFAGKKYEKINGYCCGIGPVYDSSYNFEGVKRDRRFLKPRSSVPLAENYFSKQFAGNDAELIKKAVLLSNNPSFAQHAKLRGFSPSKAEKKILLDSTKIYIENLYRTNKACINLFNSFIDTVIEYSVKEKNELQIDSVNSFIDNDGNKLIAILFPTDHRWPGMYPFNDDCMREESPMYFRILCHMDNRGKLMFLLDQLQYLDHGDFDNDGKDEYLFWTSSHNRDGYVMYYNDFKKVVQLVWNYH